MNDQFKTSVALLIIFSVGGIVNAEEARTDQSLFLQADAVIDYFSEFNVPREGGRGNYGGVLPGGGIALQWRPYPLLQLGFSTNFSMIGYLGYFDFSTRAGADRSVH